MNGITCRALIDSGAGSSYISAKLAAMLNVKPVETRTSKIDMLLTSKTTRLEIYEATVESKVGDYAMDVKLIKVEKGELLTVDNPHYNKLQEELTILNKPTSSMSTKNPNYQYMSCWEVVSTRG